VVGGLDARSTETAAALYRLVVDTVVPVSSSRAASSSWPDTSTRRCRARGRTRGGGAEQPLGSFGLAMRQMIARSVTTWTARGEMPDPPAT